MIPNLRKPEGDLPKVGASAPSVVPSSMTSPGRTPSAGGRTGAPSVIGPDLVVAGNLVSKGEVQIDGEVQGDVHSSYVVVGEKARITGSVIADEVVVRGEVMGSIRSKRVILQSTSHVEGDIHHSALAIEQGAFFEGKSRRSEDPTAGITRPELLPPPQSSQG